MKLQSQNVMAQDGFHLELGATQLYSKDNVFSLLKFQGQLVQPHIGYRRNKGGNRQWSIYFSPGLGSIFYNKELAGTDRTKHFTSSRYQAGLELDYLFRSTTSRWLGVGFISSAMILDFDGFDNGSWYTQQALAVKAKEDFSLSDRLNLISRPSYSEVDEWVVIQEDSVGNIIYGRSELYAIGQFINPIFQVRLYPSNSSRWYLKARYYYHGISSIKSFREHGLGVSLGYTFYKKLADEK